ncbi:MAG: AraC family transcriptional regulator [Lachnospiraceae bacterium]|nr:AraC family transcriptional regulator [Lachnospiraceae bacterium]
MTNQYLNNLYRDLLSNSPQTVTVDIPSDMGTGRISQIVTKQGAVVSDWKMNYFSDMNVQGINSEEYVQLLFCFQDGVSWSIADQRQGASIQKGESCIYRGHGKMEYLCYAGNSEFLFKNIKIPLSYFYKILKGYFEDREIDAYEKKLLTGISKVSITPYMEHIFAELKDFAQYRGGLGYLFLESKILELLSVYLSEVLELRILASGCISISKSDRDAIIEAKRIIDSQLAFAPGCEELARKVGISTSKLTKGFSSMFGTSVHAYVIDQRLEKAAGLLLESGLNVSQVAALVGYSKPSNFAAAFKKKYGVIPKNYKTENMIG